MGRRCLYTLNIKYKANFPACAHPNDAHESRCPPWFSTGEIIPGHVRGRGGGSPLSCPDEQTTMSLALNTEILLINANSPKTWTAGQEIVQVRC